MHWKGPCDVWLSLIKGWSPELVPSSSRRSRAVCSREHHFTAGLIRSLSVSWGNTGATRRRCRLYSRPWVTDAELKALKASVDGASFFRRFNIALKWQLKFLLNVDSRRSWVRFSGVLPCRRTRSSFIQERLYRLDLMQITMYCLCTSQRSAWWGGAFSDIV